MRTFKLVQGITNELAEGVEFSDGSVSLRWHATAESPNASFCNHGTGLAQLGRYHEGVVEFDDLILDGGSP